jgi:hypothetical protein
VAYIGLPGAQLAKSAKTRQLAAGVSITPMELGWTRRIEFLPMHRPGDSDGQNMEGKFPMVGESVEMERGDNQLLGQVDMIIVSLRC